MNKPTLDELMPKVDSKYTLVVISAKRARKITEKLADTDEAKINPVSIALKEVCDGQIFWERTKSGIK